MKRFGVSLEDEILKKFDNYIKSKSYSNRSKAIKDLIRQELVKHSWTENKEVAGIISIVYDHHKREIVDKIVSIQHDFHEIIISAQHIHLDHCNCLEVIITRGYSRKIQLLSDKLKTINGVYHTTLSITATGKEVK